MSLLRSTRTGSLPPCINLCCSSAYPFFHPASFRLVYIIVTFWCRSQQRPPSDGFFSLYCFRRLLKMCLSLKKVVLPHFSFEQVKRCSPKHYSLYIARIHDRCAYLRAPLVQAWRPLFKIPLPSPFCGGSRAPCALSHRLSLRCSPHGA